MDLLYKSEQGNRVILSLYVEKLESLNIDYKTSFLKPLTIVHTS